MCSDFPLFLGDTRFAWVTDVIVLSVDGTLHILFIIQTVEMTALKYYFRTSPAITHWARKSHFWKVQCNSPPFGSLSTNKQSCCSIMQGDEFLRVW